MGGVGALVAEVAVDLEDALDSADHCPLEEQFWRDTQVEVDVEGVGMGHERTCRRAAVQRLQHRGLDLEESSGDECLAQLGDHRDTGPRSLTRFRTHDEVDVALTDARLLVHLLVRNRQRTQRLRRHRPLIGHHRQFAGTRADDLTVDVDDVAEVDVGLPAGKRLLADPVETDHGLELGTVALLQRGEAELALVAQEDHAPGDADL